MVELNRKHNLSTIPSIDNDGNAYVIPLDIYKEGYQAYDISNWFKGRVGDNGTPFAIRWYSHGRLLNILGKRPFIEGQVGDYTIDDSDPDNPQITMAEDAANIHVVGDVNDTQEGGVAIYHLISQAFPKSGIFYGKIGFMGTQDDGTLVNTGVDIVFKVLAGHMNMLGARQFYVSELEKAWLDLQEKIRQYDQQYSDKIKQQDDQFKSDTEKALADLNTKIANEIKRAEDTLGDTQAAIDSNLASLKNISASVGALQAQIEADNLETRPEHIADITLLKQQIGRGISEITPYPETYADLSAVQRQYPTGTNKLIVTDDGHRAVYRDGSWKDGGVFQTTGITDNSITANKLTNRAKTPWSSWQSPVIVDFKNNFLTVPDGTHLLQDKLLFTGNTYIISESDKAKLAQETQNATTEEEKNKIKDFKPSYAGIFVSFDPNAVNASNQFKFYDSPDEIPESEFYVGWINFAPTYNFNFVFQAVSADNKYIYPNSQKNDLFDKNSIPRNDDFIYTTAAWNFDFESLNLNLPAGATFQYKQDLYNIASGTYTIGDASKNPRYLYIYCNITADNKATIVGSSSQTEQTNTHILIGYADSFARIFYLRNLTTSSYIKPQCNFINITNKKITVDFDKKVIHFPDYVHAIIDSKDESLPAFDLPLHDEDINNQSDALAYFVVVDPSANYSKDRTKCFKMYNYKESFVNSYVKVLGWVEPNTKTYDFGSLGSSFEEQEKNVIFPWRNKKVTCFGDSITQGDSGENGLIPSYVPRMQEWLQTMPTNAGLCGSKITEVEGDETASFIDRMGSIKDQDVITIFGGINDFQWNAPLGKMTDSADNPTTFYGALKDIVITLSRNNPKAKLMFITPMKTTKFQYHTFDDNGALMKNANGNTQLDFVNAIKQVADYYSIPVLDMYSCSNYSPYLPNQVGHDNFTADGLHPTERGYERIAQQIAKAINEL